MIVVGMKAPPFKGLQQFSGKTLILYFYPQDFGVIAPDELLQIEKQTVELERIGCGVMALSQCCPLSHDQFKSLDPSKRGVSGISFPLLADTNGEIAEKYGVKSEGGCNYRAFFIIDTEGIVRARVIQDLPIGIGITDLVRKVQAVVAE